MINVAEEIRKFWETEKMSKAFAREAISNSKFFDEPLKKGEIEDRDIDLLADIGFQKFKFKCSKEEGVQYCKKIAKKFNIPYFTALNFYTPYKDMRFTDEEIRHYLPLLKGRNTSCVNQPSKYSLVKHLESVIKKEPNKKNCAKTLKEFRKKHPKINYVFWPLIDYLVYVGVENIEDFKKEKKGIRINFDEIDTHDNSPPQYITSKYWRVGPAYAPLEIKNFFDLNAIGLVIDKKEYYPEYKDKLVWLGTEYVNRITEQTRAEAMEMEALGYKFERLKDRMNEFVPKERLEELQQTIDSDEPFMFSNFNLKELYLYYTLHTDKLFCFFQPVWHKHADALEKTLIIKQFIQKPTYENAKEAVIAMDQIHCMSHTTETTFLAQTYEGYTEVPKDVYTVRPPYKPKGKFIGFPVKTIEFKPQKTELGDLGITTSKPINYWLPQCSPNLALLVEMQYEKKILNHQPLIGNGDTSSLTYGVNFVNLNKIKPKQVKKELINTL